MRYCCDLQQGARVGHGRNPNTAHSLILWYYVCTCSDHEPVIEKKVEEEKNEKKELVINKKGKNHSTTNAK